MAGNSISPMGGQQHHHRAQGAGQQQANGANGANATPQTASANPSASGSGAQTDPSNPIDSLSPDLQELLNQDPENETADPSTIASLLQNLTPDQQQAVESNPDLLSQVEQGQNPFAQGTQSPGNGQPAAGGQPAAAPQAQPVQV